LLAATFCWSEDVGKREFSGKIRPYLATSFASTSLAATGIVEFEIGFIAKTLCDFVFGPHLRYSNPLWLILSLALVFAYFPCSEVVHVKYRLLLEDLVT
jgi:hypothetical protein